MVIVSSHKEGEAGVFWACAAAGLSLSKPRPKHPHTPYCWDDTVIYTAAFTLERV